MELYIGDLILNDVISDFCVSFQTIFLYTCGSHSEVKMLREMSNGFAFTLWVKHAPQKFPLASYLHRCHVYFFMCMMSFTLRLCLCTGTAWPELQLSLLYTIPKAWLKPDEVTHSTYPPSYSQHQKTYLSHFCCASESYIWWIMTECGLQ